MKKSLLIKIIVGICLALTVAGGIIVLNINRKQNLKVESSRGAEKQNYDFKIITDVKFRTLQNDGGSHINIYYLVNLKKNKIVKYEDKYVGLKGYEYKDKIVYEKYIDDTINTKLQDTILDLTTKKDINKKNNYNYYTIEDGNNEKIIYSDESIEALENIFSIIDKQ